MKIPSLYPLSRARTGRRTSKVHSLTPARVAWPPSGGSGRRSVPRRILGSGRSCVHDETRHLREDPLGVRDEVPYERAGRLDRVAESRVLPDQEAAVFGVAGGARRGHTLSNLIAPPAELA